jgi:hypothetical protein
MRRSWAANALAAITIGLTLFVGVLGAQGTPKVARTKQPVPSAKPSPPKNAAAGQSVGVPRCRGRLASANLSFACPDGWFVWENDAFTSDPYQRVLIIIANHRPLAHGGEDLPDGWFKTDVGVSTRDPRLTFAGVQRDTCKSPTGTEIVDSCRRTRIAGREWVLAVARDTGYEYRTIATVLDGVEYRVSAYIRLGRTADEGRQEIARLFASFLVG